MMLRFLTFRSLARLKIWGQPRCAATTRAEAARPPLPDQITEAIERCVPEPLRPATERLVGAAYAAGVAQERQRVREIMNLPSARGFTPLAYELACRGDVTPAEADRALCAAAIDAATAAVSAAGAEPPGATIH